MRSAIFLLIIVLSLAGCSFRSIALRSTVELLGNGAEAIYEERDLQLAEESFGGQIKLLEMLLKNDPANPDLLLLTAQGFGAYSFLFLESTDAERAKSFYERGRGYGLDYLDRKCSQDILKQGDSESFAKGMSRLKRKDVPLLFWTAYCWGGWANLSRDNPQAIADLPKVERMMLRVNELLPGYFYSGADLFLGSYYGDRPRMFGGNLEKSKFYFDRAVQVSAGKFLMTQVLYARYYAVPSQDKELFRKLLQEVLDFPLDEFPEQRLSNQAAKLRAKSLLDKIGDLF